MKARFGDRGAAADSATVWRRFVLVVIASAVMIVGAFTADHVESFSTSDHRAGVTVTSSVAPIDAGATLPTAAGAEAPGVELVGEQVLLICSVLGLAVAFLLVALAGPRAGAVQRLVAGRVLVALPAHVVRVGVVRLDRTALCIIRT